MFKRYLLAITFCLSSIFFFSGILYSTTQKIIKLDTHSKNIKLPITILFLLNPYIAQIQIFSSSIH